MKVNLLPTITFLVLSVGIAGQQKAPPATSQPLPKPSPTPVVTQREDIDEQDPIKISTEEIQLSVAALDSNGRRDAALVRDDVLILEDGVPQEIKSVRRLPANIVLLLDTGGDITSIKRVPVTREVAIAFVNTLATDDQLSVLQFNNRVEVLSEWNRDPKTVVPILQSKLFPGKRTRFLTAVAAAIERFNNSSRLNRHLVMITDGVQSEEDHVDRAALFRQMTAANVTVHVISYTALSQLATKDDMKRVRKRYKSIVSDDAVNSLPDEKRANIAKQAHDPGGIVVDLDPDRRRKLKEYQRAAQISQVQLESMAADTGGGFWVPESIDSMLDSATNAARSIDAAYVLTYKPKRSLTTSKAGEVRRIEIASRRVGLQLTTRRRYVVPADLLSGETRPRRINE